MFLLALLLSFFSFITPAQAVSDFQVNQKISYIITDEGDAKINHEVTLTNNFSEIYPREYQMSILGTNIQDIVGSDGGGNIIQKTSQLNDNTSIHVLFHNSKLGKGQQHKFYLNYKIPKLATKKGNTWELPLPDFKNIDPQDTIDLSLQYPNSFGNLSYSSIPSARTNNFGQNNLIELNEKNINNKKILFIFGDYQLFDLNLNYYLHNPNNQNITREIPLPPDTNIQKIVYENITPPPQNVRVDQDGNWLAQYTLSPQQELNIKVIGQARVFSKSNNQNQISNKDYLSSSNYWPVNDTSIKQISSQFKSVKDIYDYIQNTLEYNYDSINQNAYRKGALTALLEPKSSLCTEFTDVFVTFSRAINIPAREIEGYAYSNNTKIKPVISGDILHAWPQYYDFTKTQWVDIDPTWAKTTNGIDFFNDLDLNHIAFVIHGISSESPPPPGSYKKNPQEQSINVDFATTPIIDSNLPVYVSYQTKKQTIIISNPNGHSITQIKASIDNTSWQQNIDFMPPFSKLEFKLPSFGIIQSILPNNKDFLVRVSHQNSSADIVQKIPYLSHYRNLSLFIAIIIISSLVTSVFIMLRKKK